MKDEFFEEESQKKAKKVNEWRYELQKQIEDKK